MLYIHSMAFCVLKYKQLIKVIIMYIERSRVLSFDKKIKYAIV